MRILLILLISSAACADSVSDIRTLAKSNGFSPSDRVVLAIVDASARYHVSAKELAAIAILETGLGKYGHKHINSNGSVDAGLFQINSVNLPNCIEYNVDSIEGNAYCAAKILSNIARKHADYLGRYHSKTPKHKISYEKAVLNVLHVEESTIDQKLAGF